MSIKKRDFCKVIIISNDREHSELEKEHMVNCF